MDERVKLQIFLTASGYWPAVPNADFSSRLYDAISRFQLDHGFAADGYLTGDEIERLIAEGGPLLNKWGFQTVALPQGGAIWVPFGLGLIRQGNATGYKYSDQDNRLTLTFDYFPKFTVRRSFEALADDLKGRGFRIEYQKIYRDEFFVISASGEKVDTYVRYHQAGLGGIGFSLVWNHDASEIHGERIATLISGSLWSSLSGAPFTAPFVFKPKEQVEVSLPQKPDTPDASVAEPPTSAEPAHFSSGTGFYVTRDGLILTNAHVVKGCTQVKVSPSHGDFMPATVFAVDPTNDLALLKTNSTPPRTALVRTSVRLGEGVEAFGYPLSDMLATSGNFTLGNVSALEGLGDDTRYLQISAPVQPGNSGGPLLDQSGNLVGVVSAKLNALKIMVATNGDIPQNVNFAIKSSVAATFLQANSVKFETGDLSQSLQSPDLADQAKAMSVFVLCQ